MCCWSRLHIKVQNQTYMFHWGTVTIFWISYLHKGKKLRKQQEPEQQRSAYFLGWPIYIFIRLCAHFSDVIKWETWSALRSLWRSRNTFGDYLRRQNYFKANNEAIWTSSFKEAWYVCRKCLSVRLLIVKSFLFPEICNFKFMLQHGKPTMNWFLPSDRCDRWIKDCFLSVPYIDRSLNPKAK